MRDFTDSDGTQWTAASVGESGVDYKGRFFLILTSAKGVTVSLPDVRWNTQRTAARTLKTMSEVELRRRLRSARGRGYEAIP